MKKLIYLLLLLLYGYTAKAGFVAANTAKYVAAQHFNANGIAADTTDLSTYATKTIIVAGKPTPVYYVFNYKTNGFILISATDDVPPVLAWSSEAVFDSTNLPPNSVFWFNNLYTQLAYRLGKQLPATQAAMAQWQQLLHGSTGNFADKTNGSSP